MSAFQPLSYDLTLTNSHIYDLQLVDAYNLPLDDIFAIIGAKCGFFHQPTDGKEPAKCDPNTASTLQQFYKTHLYQFDTAYIKSQMLQQGLHHSTGFTNFTTQMDVGISARPSLLQDSQPTLSASNPAAKLIMQMVATGALDQKKLDRLLALAKSSDRKSNV